MSDRVICLLIALVLGGVCYLFVDGTRSNHDELARYGDFDQWVRSPGTLNSLDVRLASSGRNTGYVVTCEYSYVFGERTWTSTSCDLGSPPLLGEAAAKARAQSILGLKGEARWRAVRHDRFDGWVLEQSKLPVSVRHSTRLPQASTLTDVEPLPAYLYWLLIALTSVLGLASALGSLFFLFIAWAVGPQDWLKDPHWCELLFRNHPKRQLREWARAMRYFRFIRGAGGGMGDYGDRLAVVLKAESQQDIEQILAALGVSARPLSLEPAAAGRGFVAFEAVQGTEPAESAAPGLVLVCGVQVAVYCTPGRVELSITDREQPTEVTQAAVDAAREVEVLLTRLADRVIDPPQDDKHCVSPVFYPSFWQEDKPGTGTPLSLPDIESTAEKKRSRGLLMAWSGFGLVCVAVIAWLDLEGVQWGLNGMAIAPAAHAVLVHLQDLGDVWLAVGVFVLPGLFLLLRARWLLREARRDSRRQRRRLFRGR